MANENEKKKEGVKLEQQSLEILKERLQTLEKLEEQYSKINKIQGTFEQSAAKEKAALEAKVNLLNIEDKIKEKLQALAEEAKNAGEENLFNVKEQLKNLKKTGEIAAVNSDELTNLILKYKEAREESEKLTKESKEYEKALSSARNMADKLGKKSMFFSTNIIAMAKKMKKELIEGGVGGIQARIDALKDQFMSFTNFFASSALIIVDVTTKLVKAADTATTTLAAATGMGRELNGVLISAQKSGNIFGLSMEESGKAIAALVGGTTNFVNISKASQAAIAKNVGLLSKLGVSAETSAEMIQNLNLNLGMTMDQASEAAVSLAMMGTELGISASQITKDFNQSLGTLAVYGPRATTVFKNLAASAKSAGVETSKLLGIAKKFDTFGEAANTVGRLNALLGTQLSTTEMLMKTEDERIETLIESVQAQGVAFNELDRFQQKAIAAAAGIDDLAEAQRIFGMDVGMYRKYQEEMKENENAQAKFQEALSASIPIATKIMSIFNEFGIMVMPILEGVSAGLDTLRNILADISPETKELFGQFVVLTGALLTMKAVLGPIFGLLGGIGGLLGIGGGAAAGGGLIAGVGGLGAALAGMWPVLLALAVAAGGIYLLNKALSSNKPTPVRASGRIENSAITSTGTAGRTMSNRSVQPQIVRSGGSQQVNVKMPEKVILKVGEKEFEGYFKDLAANVASGR